jgi:hypothetical protein
MKITKFFALMCAAALGFVACEPINSNEPAPEVTGSITLEASSTTVELGESVTFTATMKDAETGEITDVTAFVSIYDSELNKVSNPWTPSASGSYTFNATFGAESSNNVTITVLAQMPKIPADPDPSNTKFNHRAVIIDHTGVNCGYCPMMTESLLLLEKSEWHGYYNEVTCHAGSMASGDPGNSAAANALNEMQKPNGYPNLNINFYTAIVGNYGGSATVNYIAQALNGYIKKNGADVGISMAVDGDTNTILCAAEIKSAVTKEYKVNAWMLESNINGKGQAGATKPEHKIYNHAIRNTSEKITNTDVQGRSIGVLEAGQTFTYEGTIPVSKDSWNWENMGVLVIVSAQDAQGRWEIVNSAYCKVGENKPYEYIVEE